MRAVLLVKAGDIYGSFDGHATSGQRWPGTYHGRLANGDQHRRGDGKRVPESLHVHLLSGSRIAGAHPTCSKMAVPLTVERKCPRWTVSYTHLRAHETPE